MVTFFHDICKKMDSMDWQQMQDTFYNCLDFCGMKNRLPYFYITGGDPILHPDFWRLLELLCFAGALRGRISGCGTKKRKQKRITE